MDIWNPLDIASEFEGPRVKKDAQRSNDGSAVEYERQYYQQGDNGCGARSNTSPSWTASVAAAFNPQNLLPPFSPTDQSADEPDNLIPLQEQISSIQQQFYRYFENTTTLVLQMQQKQEAAFQQLRTEIHQLSDKRETEAAELKGVVQEATEVGRWAQQLYSLQLEVKIHKNAYESLQGQLHESQTELYLKDTELRHLQATVASLRERVEEDKLHKVSREWFDQVQEELQKTQAELQAALTELQQKTDRVQELERDTRQYQRAVKVLKRKEDEIRQLHLVPDTASSASIPTVELHIHVVEQNDAENYQHKNEVLQLQLFQLQQALENAKGQSVQDGNHRAILDENSQLLSKLSQVSDQLQTSLAERDKLEQICKDLESERACFEAASQQLHVVVTEKDKLQQTCEALERQLQVASDDKASSASTHEDKSVQVSITEEVIKKDNSVQATLVDNLTRQDSSTQYLNEDPSKQDNGSQACVSEHPVELFLKTVDCLNPEQLDLFAPCNHNHVMSELRQNLTRSTAHNLQLLVKVLGMQEDLFGHEPAVKTWQPNLVSVAKQHKCLGQVLHSLLKEFDSGSSELTLDAVDVSASSRLVIDLACQTDVEECNDIASPDVTAGHVLEYSFSELLKTESVPQLREALCVYFARERAVQKELQDCRSKLDAFLDVSRAAAQDQLQLLERDIAAEGAVSTSWEETQTLNNYHTLLSMISTASCLHGERASSQLQHVRLLQHQLDIILHSAVHSLGGKLTLKDVAPKPAPVEPVAETAKQGNHFVHHSGVDLPRQDLPHDHHDFFVHSSSYDDYEQEPAFHYHEPLGNAQSAPEPRLNDPLYTGGAWWDTPAAVSFNDLPPLEFIMGSKTQEE